MIYYIKGKITNKLLNSLIIENSGIGYEVIMGMERTANFSEGDNITVYVYYYHKEDRVELYGFENPKDREMFKMLISISGIGPKQAIRLVSALGSDGIIRAVYNDDESGITKIKGFGKKSAQTILFQLKSKIKDVSEPISAIKGNLREITILALKNLGFKYEDILYAMKRIKDIPQTSEEYIKLCLKELSSL